MTTPKKNIKSPLENFIVRSATMEDLAAVIDLFNASSMDTMGINEFTLERYQKEWSTPGFNLETDCQLVTTLDGTVVGVTEIWCLSPYVRIFAWVRVHPDYRGQGIGTYLTEWGEERARKAIPLAPEGARVLLEGGNTSTHQPAKELLEAQGYTLARHFISMKIEMDSPPPEAIWPKGITIRTMKPDDDLAFVYRAIDDAFKDHWGHVDEPFEEGFAKWQHWVISDPDYNPALWFLAMAGEEIAGLSLCMPWASGYTDMSYVDTLGVRRPWRRQGLALALLHHSFAQFYQRGVFKVSLDVDASSLTGATRLYEKAGMHTYRQFSLFRKELRPGKDLTTQAVE